MTAYGAAVIGWLIDSGENESANILIISLSLKLLFTLEL